MPGTWLRALARRGTWSNCWALRAFVPIALAASLCARADVTVLDAPNVTVVRAGQVETLATMADGSAIVGGTFSSVNGVARSAIAKIRPDGSLDPDWNPPTGGRFNATVVDGAGNVYVGGDFALYKLDGSTGAIDTAFFASPNGSVRALAIGPDGSLFAGGGFTAIGGTPRNRLAKLNPATGAVDNAWTLGANGTVYALAATSAGALYVGGDFTTVGGASRKNLARVGTAAGAVTDSTWGPQARSVVHALVPAGSQIYVAGTQPTSGVTQYLARYSTSDGAIDATWNPALDAPAYALALVSGAIFAAGDFNYVRGETHTYVARIPTTGDGHADAAWNPVLDGSAHALATSGDLARVEVGGTFSRVGSALYLAAATLSTSDGSVAGAPHDAETPGFVSKMAPQPDGGVVVGGTFDKVDQLRRENLFRLKPDRTLDPSWEADVRGSDIYALLAGPDSAVYVAGPFSDINGVPRLGIAKLDGESGAVDPSWDAASSSTATSLAWAADGDLVVGGLFTTIGGESRRYLAKLGPDASADPDWDPSPDNGVRTLAQGTGDALYVGGDFMHIGGLERHYLAKIAGSGTGGADPAWSSAAGNLISYIVTAPDGSLYAQGVFDGTSDVTHSKATKLDRATGAVDTTWNLSPAPISAVQSMAFDASGRVYAAGLFYAIDGEPVLTSVARASPTTGDIDPTWNPRADAAAVVAVGDDDTIYVGGNLTTIGGLSRQVIAAVAPDAVEDTVLTITSIDPEPSHTGEPYTVSFRVDAPEGTPTGSVTISDDAGAGCGPIDLVDGAGSCEMVSARGFRTLTALYSSDDVAFNDTTAVAGHFVDNALTTVTITADTPDPSEAMSEFEIDAQVETAYPDDGPGPTGLVTFTDDEGYVCTASVDASGNAACLISASSPGTQVWTAAYSGDGAYDASESEPETHTVSRVGVSLSVFDYFPAVVTTQPDRFGIQIATAFGIPTGNVTITDGTSSCTVEITDSFVWCDLSFAHAGEHEITVTYEGDELYAPAESDPVTLFVSPAETAVSIRSHVPEPSVPGQPVTVTVDAVVLPPGVGAPTGSLLVSGSFEQTECTIGASGGSCDLVYTARGSQQLEADFLANDDFLFSVVVGSHRVNELPLATGDSYPSFEDQPLAVDAAAGVLANDSDPDGDPLTIVDAGPRTATGIGGTVVLAPDGSFTYTPPANANGKAGFRYTISDGLETADGAVALTVGAVNDPPTFALAPSPTFAPGTIGVQTTPAFATMTSSGPPDEDDAPLAWHVRIVSDPSGVLSAPATIALDGTLTTPLTGHGGMATLAVALQDDGGTEHGGQDTSPEQTFTITVGDGTDLSIAIEDDTAFVAGGDAIAYRITVRNNGPENATGARVRAVLSANLVDAAWTCSAQTGASCSAGGSGEIDDLAGIPSGSAVVYTLTATTLAIPEFPAEVDATVTAPSGLTDFNPGNDSASDIDVVGIFADGFDTPEAGTDRKTRAQ